MKFAELKESGTLVVTDHVCEYCKEAKDRDTIYLVELPNPTRNQSLKARVCPFCDGESLIEKAYSPRDEQERPKVS